MPNHRPEISRLLKDHCAIAAGEDFPVPFPRSYWVVSSQLLAGCYPGATDLREAEVKLCGLLHTGIRTVVNLMESEETDYHGRPFQPYEDYLCRRAVERGSAITCLRMPIVDQSIPTRETMRRILDAIDASLAGGAPVYVHCWGGKGRTGTVVGCWLARHGLATGDAALRMVQHLRRNDPTAGQPSPENRVQCDMVREWRA